MTEIKHCGVCAFAERPPADMDVPKRVHRMLPFLYRCTLDNDIVSDLQYCGRWTLSDETHQVSGRN